MENSDISFTPRFYLNVDAKYVRFTDGTDYAGEGKNVNYVYGNVKITTPNGVMYNNTDYDADADIVGSSGTFYKNFVLPLDGVYVVAGTYTFEYTVKIIDGVNTIETYTKSTSYTYSFIEPTLAVTFNIDGYNSTFSCVESTTYASSAYASTVSRVLTITPPSGSGMATTSDTETTMTNPSVTYSANIYSGTYTASLVSTILYVMGDGLEIYTSDTLSDSEYAYKIDMDALRDDFYSYISTYYTQKSVSGNSVRTIEENLHKLSSSYAHYLICLDYQDLEEAYDSALRIYIILEGTTPTVAEIVPFENLYSFTNTDEKVKMTSTGTASYLADLVDGTTIQNNSGVLSVVGSLSDYVSAANGGTFSDVVKYGSDLSGSYDSRTFVDKAYADSLVTSLIALTDLSSTATGLTYTSGTGVFSWASGYSLPTDSEQEDWTNAYNFVNALTASTAELNYVDGVTSAIQTQLDAKQASLTFGIANTNAVQIDSASVADDEYARFTTSGLESRSVAELAGDIQGSILHNSLSTFQGGTTNQYYHLTSAQHTIATQAASGSQDGYLSQTDWSTFNGKQATMSAGTGITVSSNTISSKDSEIVHDSLSGFVANEHYPCNDSLTTSTNLWSASKVNSVIDNLSNVYTISATAGSGTVISRTFTQGYGWTVDDSQTINYGSGLGAAATSLTIQHDLGKHCAGIVVKAYGNFGYGNCYQVLTGIQAFSTWYESSDLNAIELTGLSTQVYPLEIVLTFSGSDVTTTTTTAAVTTTTTTV